MQDRSLSRLRARIAAGEAIVAGVLSGTSADGIDVALARCTGLDWRGAPLGLELLAMDTLPFEHELAARVRLVLDRGSPELGHTALLHRDLGRAFGRAARLLAQQEALVLDLVASHGQTVWHHDGRQASGAATLQLGEGDFVAEAAGAPVACDFRQRDLACGGQGAPITALVDELLFAQLPRPAAILNLGGISNLTLLGAAHESLLAFDCGPAAALLDGLARRLLDAPMDRAGAVAQRGRVDARLSAALARHPFFALPAPKSTGRDTFGEGWLEREVLPALARLELAKVEDQLASAVDFVAWCVADALARAGAGRAALRSVVVAGGGVHNRALLAALGQRLDLPVVSSAAHGVDPKAREALAFAALGLCCVLEWPLTTPSATGARSGGVLGKLCAAPGGATEPGSAAAPLRRGARARAVGALIVPELRVDGWRPDDTYLERYAPRFAVAFGRSKLDGSTRPGLADALLELREQCTRLGLAQVHLACDLEEGAGLHFPAATRLPPALAWAAAEAGARARGEQQALRWIHGAGFVTGREARALGISLVLAPVLDLNTRASNPIIATRSLGAQLEPVARRAQAFLTGLHLGGALGCAKHFPGHGDSEQDSHVVLPRILRTRAELEALELAIYRRMLAAEPGLDALMAAHLDVPELTGTPGLPTSLAPRCLEGLLRGELGFREALFSDGLAMGALQGRQHLGAEALRAGVDGLLGPADAWRFAAELERDAEAGGLERELERSRTRLERLQQRAAQVARAAGQPSTAARLAALGLDPRLFDSAAARQEFAAQLAAAALTELAAWPVGAALERLDVFPESGAGWSGVPLFEAEWSAGERRSGGGSLLVAGCRVGAGRGRAGLEQEQEQRLVAAAREALHQGPAGLLWFGSPQVLPLALRQLPSLGLWCAYSTSPPMQLAAARALRGQCRPGGSLPLGLG